MNVKVHLQFWSPIIDGSGIVFVDAAILVDEIKNVLNFLFALPQTEQSPSSIEERRGLGREDGIASAIMAVFLFASGWTDGPIYGRTKPYYRNTSFVVLTFFYSSKMIWDKVTDGRT